MISRQDTDILTESLACLEIDLDWPWNIFWTDKAHGYLDGTMYTQSCPV